MYIVYQKSLIFKPSFLQQNNLCEFHNTHTQIQRFFVIKKIRFYKKNYLNIYFCIYVFPTPQAFVTLIKFELNWPNQIWVYIVSERCDKKLLIPIKHFCPWGISEKRGTEYLIMGRNIQLRISSWSHSKGGICSPNLIDQGHMPIMPHIWTRLFKLLVKLLKNLHFIYFLQ